MSEHRKRTGEKGPPNSVPRNVLSGRGVDGVAPPEKQGTSFENGAQKVGQKGTERIMFRNRINVVRKVDLQIARKLLNKICFLARPPNLASGPKLNHSGSRKMFPGISF